MAMWTRLVLSSGIYLQIFSVETYHFVLYAKFGAHIWLMTNCACYTFIFGNVYKCVGHIVEREKERRKGNHLDQDNRKSHI